MYFKKPFRTDSYKQHLEDQHPEHWKQYQSTSDALKKTYFQDRAPAVSFQNRSAAHLPGIQVPTHHTDRKGIVDIIIGEMYFKPNEEDVLHSYFEMTQQEPSLGSKSFLMHH